MVRFGAMLWTVYAIVAAAAACASGVGGGGAGKWLTVYQKIAQEADLSEFHALLQANRVAKASLYHRGVTVFAPNNAALAAFNGTLTQHLVSYHVIYGARTLGDFEETSLESVQEDCPPAWVTRRGGYFYVNNALVLDYPKGFVSRNRQDVYGKTQVLYVIDEVLDPVVKNTTNPTAYDFLSRTPMWTSAYTTGVFFTGLIHNRLENIFRSEGNYTFFLPVDAGGEHHLQFFDAYSVKAHIVPNRVLFTRPSGKFVQYETLTSGDYISVTISLIQENGKFYARGNTTLGDSNHQTGVVKSEIVMGNIPVKNGVVHLISKPLAVYSRRLSKFPAYLSVLDKFSMDPMLNTSYVIALNSGFNEYFGLAKSKKFTFFVPRDVAWRRLRPKFDVQTIMNPSLYYLARQLLERHLVIGEVPITMETLEFATSKTCVNLTTPAGKMCVSAARRPDDGQYVLRWKQKEIVVSRANYECSDGIVHVVDAPFMSDEDFASYGRRTYVNFVQIWNALQKLLL